MVSRFGGTPDVSTAVHASVLNTAAKRRLQHHAEHMVQFLGAGLTGTVGPPGSCGSRSSEGVWIVPGE